MQVTLNALPASLAEFRNLSLTTPDEVLRVTQLDLG